MRRPSGTATRSVWIAATAAAALFVLTALIYRAPAPLDTGGSSEQFSAVRASQILQRLVGDGVPHPLGSPANDTMRERVVRELRAIGLEPELQRGMACHDGDACGIVTNVIARIEGSQAGEQALLLSAHYDSVPAGPGASDDGAGVAAVLEIARLLKQAAPLRHPVILLIDDGEEAGMLGAQLFVDAHRWGRQVGAAVNLEARGTSGPSFMFETGSANDWLMDLYARALARPMTNSVYYLAYKLLPNDTDFTVYKTVDYQGFNFAFLGDVEHYHTPLDRWQNTDLGSLQHQGANALAVVRALGGSELQDRPRAQAVFFDWYGLVLVHWRAGLTPFAAVGAALLLSDPGGARPAAAATPGGGTGGPISVGRAPVADADRRQSAGPCGTGTGSALAFQAQWLLGNMGRGAGSQRAALSHPLADSTGSELPIPDPAPGRAGRCGAGSIRGATATVDAGTRGAAATVGRRERDLAVDTVLIRGPWRPGLVRYQRAGRPGSVGTGAAAGAGDGTHAPHLYRRAARWSADLHRNHLDAAGVFHGVAATRKSRLRS